MQETIVDEGKRTNIVKNRLNDDPKLTTEEYDVE